MTAWHAALIVLGVFTFAIMVGWCGGRAPKTTMLALAVLLFIIVWKGGIS